MAPPARVAARPTVPPPHGRTRPHMSCSWGSPSCCLYPPAISHFSQATSPIQPRHQALPPPRPSPHHYQSRNMAPRYDHSRPSETPDHGFVPSTLQTTFFPDVPPSPTAHSSNGSPLTPPDLTPQFAPATVPPPSTRPYNSTVFCRQSAANLQLDPYPIHPHARQRYDRPPNPNPHTDTRDFATIVHHTQLSPHFRSTQPHPVPVITPSPAVYPYEYD